MTSLLAQTKLDVGKLPLGLLLSPLLGILDGVLKPLDDIVGGILSAVGVSLGEMDVRVDDLVCSNPKIVG